MKTISLLLLALTITASTALAQGSLMVNPKRIILTDRQRIGDITLFNSGSDTSSFVISLVHYEMEESGKFDEIPDSVHTYASTYCDSLIRYFPAEVTLPPHESQAVHVRFMKPMGMAPGEYRSHMYFRALERAAPIEEKARDTSQHTISLVLRPIFGISIPIIVRSGTSPATVTMDSASISAVDTAGRGTITALVHRNGNESCYGSLLVFYQAPDGTSTQIGIVKGIAVYVPLAARRVSVAFTIPKGTDYTKGSFKLEYQTLTDQPHEQIMAETEIAAAK